MHGRGGKEEAVKPYKLPPLRGGGANVMGKTTLLRWGSGQSPTAD